MTNMTYPNYPPVPPIRDNDGTPLELQIPGQVDCWRDDKGQPTMNPPAEFLDPQAWLGAKGGRVIASLGNFTIYEGVGCFRIMDITPEQVNWGRVLLDDICQLSICYRGGEDHEAEVDLPSVQISAVSGGYLRRLLLFEAPEKETFEGPDGEFQAYSPATLQANLEKTQVFYITLLRHLQSWGIL